MKLVPYDVKKLPSSQKGNNYVLFEEFLNMNVKCVKIENFPHKSATICSQVLRVSAKRFGLTGIKIVQKGNEVFLINTNLHD